MKPPLHIGKALSAGDVVHHDHPVCAAVVGAGDGAEPLLTRRVPDLQLHLLPVQLYSSDLEVYSDGCYVVPTEVVVCKSDQQGALANTTVPWCDAKLRIVQAVTVSWTFNIA